MRSIQAAGALVLLASLPAVAQVIQAPGSPATGPYTDTTSGMTFPVTAGEFKRFRILRGGGPQDINAGYIYISPEARMVATVFVERTPPGPTAELCQKMADIDRQVFQKGHSDAAFSDLTAPPATGYSNIAFSARYNTTNGLGATDYYYYCAEGTQWRVEYMFQHSAGFDAGPLEAAFLRDLNLTVSQKP